jgi:hypothetical protein
MRVEEGGRKVYTRVMAMASIKFEARKVDGRREGRKRRSDGQWAMHLLVSFEPV